MSSFNPAAKAGFTKSGKSLKAVRRYYALLNQNKSKSPEEDKLSKRIAVELKTQQDANEKRSKRDGPGAQPLLQDASTERSELLPGVIVSPKETGPVFIAPPPPLKSVHPTDANKSVKSVKTPNIDTETRANGGYTCTKLAYFILGLVIGVIAGAVGLYLIYKYPSKDQVPTPQPPNPRPYHTNDYGEDYINLTHRAS